jgi:hypothetical protein
VFINLLEHLFLFHQQNRELSRLDQCAGFSHLKNAQMKPHRIAKYISSDGTHLIVIPTPTYLESPTYLLQLGRNFFLFLFFVPGFTVVSNSDKGESSWLLDANRVGTSACHSRKL